MAIADAADRTGEPDDGGVPLRPQDLILTLLGTYVLPRPRPVWSGGLVTLLGAFGFSPAASRMAISRIVRRGFLDRAMDGRRSFYTLTGEGRRLLSEGEQRIFSFGSRRDGTGVWTIVSYSIPEDLRGVRDRLRKRLKFLGFASIHDATWFSPRDSETEVLELLDALGVGDHAEVFLGRPSVRTDLPRLIAQGWALEGLDATYDAFVARYGRYRGPALRSIPDDEQAFVLRTRIVHEYRRFPGLDPELPEAVVASRSRRPEAVATFHEAYDALAAPAQRHFDALASASG